MAARRRQPLYPCRFATLDNEVNYGCGRMLVRTDMADISPSHVKFGTPGWFAVCPECFGNDDSIPPGYVPQPGGDSVGNHGGSDGEPNDEWPAISPPSEVSDVDVGEPADDASSNADIDPPGSVLPTTEPEPLGSHQKCHHTRAKSERTHPDNKHPISSHNQRNFLTLAMCVGPYGVDPTHRLHVVIVGACPVAARSSVQPGLGLRSRRFLGPRSTLAVVRSRRSNARLLRHRTRQRLPADSRARA